MIRRIGSNALPRRGVPMKDETQATRLLHRIEAGDSVATAELLPLLYDGCFRDRLLQIERKPRVAAALHPI